MFVRSCWNLGSTVCVLQLTCCGATKGYSDYTALPIPLLVPASCKAASYPEVVALYSLSQVSVVIKYFVIASK
jgi:hypothetical protein